MLTFVSSTGLTNISTLRSSTVYNVSVSIPSWAAAPNPNFEFSNSLCLAKSCVSGEKKIEILK